MTLRTRLILAFIGLILLGGIAIPGDQTYTLRNKFTEGQTSYLSLEMVSNGVTHMGTLDNKINNAMEIVFSFLTQKIDPPDQVTLQMGIEKMKTKGDVPGMGKDQDLRELIGLKDVKLSLKTNALGEIVEPPSVPNAAGMSMMNTGVDKMTEQMPWIKFPSKAISLGEHWLQTRNVPLAGASKPIIANTTYTLSEVVKEGDEQVAVITTETTIHEQDILMDPAAAGQKLGNVKLKFTFKQYNYNGKGEYRFNLDQGHILSTKEDADMILEIASDLDVSGAAFPSTFTHQLHLATRGTYSNENPLTAASATAGTTPNATAP